jgi:hypothetical protein
MQQDASDVVDAYLTNGWGIGLEQVLAEATMGLVSLHLADAVRIRAERVGAFTHGDGGTSELHQGSLTVEGVTYRFRCTVFIDTGGLRYVENVAEFRPLMWQTRLPLPERGTR